MPHGCMEWLASCLLLHYFLYLFFNQKKRCRFSVFNHPCLNFRKLLLTDFYHLFSNTMLELKGTLFQKKVWDAIMNIPKGEVRTYKEIAISIGRPNVYRAVASACKHNPYPIDIPCHRVIPSTGGVGNYLGVVNCEKKKRLLEAEGVDVTLFNL
jgi:methylated-DNA-[protein]-cysteine S-methyltransferase